MNVDSKKSNKIVSYSEWIIKNRIVVMLGILLLVFATGSGARFLSFATDYRIFFSDDNPQLKAFDEIQNVYTQNDNILFVVETADRDPFSESSISILSELENEGWQVPFAIRVDAISNFQHTEADGDDLTVAALIEEPYGLTKEERERIRNIAMSEPLLKNRLLSADGSIAAVNVTVQFPGLDINEVPQTAAAALLLAENIEKKYPGTHVYLTGVVMINNAFVTSGMSDLTTVFPLMFGVIVILMIALIRSFWGTISTLTLIFMSAIAAMGVAGWFGIQLTPTSSQAPTMIMTLAVADSIHLLVTMMQGMRNGLSRHKAIIESMRVNFVPVFLTSLTTVIGFLSLNFSDSPPYQHLGNITAVGVSIAFLLSITFLPAILSMLPIKVRKVSENKNGMFRSFADWIIVRNKPILGISVIVILFALALTPNNKLNDEFVKYFDTTVKFRTDSDFAEENIVGINTIEHSINAGQSGGISEPAYLAKLDSLASWYEKQPNVLHVNHIGLIMKRLNMNMHGDDSAYYKIPADRELAAQYLLLFEMSLPYGLDLNNIINIDKSSTRFTVSCNNQPSNDLIALAQRGENWLKEHGSGSMKAVAASPGLMFSYLSKRQVKSMISGSIIALLLITVAMMFALKSVRFGLLSIIPNMIPLVLGFGAWALLVAEIGLAHSTIVGMTLGIVVDDTVHFLNIYLRGRRENGLSPEDSVRYAFDTVGKALVVTSIVLVAGFLVLSASTFKLNASLGQLSALTIGFALIADFIFLPALLLVVDRKKEIVLKRSILLSGEVVPVRVTK